MKVKVNEVYEGDCIDVMRTFPDNCIDSIITDPPYSLNFMGKKWDNEIAFNPEVWRECLRVAKPGAILMAFGGSRTHHRLACAIEDAGWEIRDCILIEKVPEYAELCRQRIAEYTGEEIAPKEIETKDGNVKQMSLW